MPSWVAELLQPDRLLTVAFILFLLWLMGKGLFKFFPFFAELVDLVRTLVGDSSKGIPGIGDRMDAQATKLGELAEKLGEHSETLEKVRAQVQNSHDTNLRDDVDGVKEAVEDLTGKLSEHITISKESDRSQAEMARQVESLAARWAEN